MSFSPNTRRTRQRLAVWIGLTWTAVCVWLLQTEMPFPRSVAQRMEAMAYDLRMVATLPAPTTDPRIVIVAIDETSVGTVGRWPWSREIIARLTEQLFEQGAAVVGFDVIFSEPEVNPALKAIGALKRDMPAAVANSLRELAPHLDYDAELGRALEGRDAVLGFLFHTDVNPSLTPLPAPLVDGTQAQWDINTINELPSYTANLRVLQNAAGTSAFLTTLSDPDGILRRSPMLLRYQGDLYGSLALQVARLFFLLDGIEVNTVRVAGRDVPESIKLGSIRVPIDGVGQAIVPYRGRSPIYRYISAADVLNGNVGADDLANKIVLVGATALALGDIVATPVQNHYPGVEVHANLLSGILDESFPVKPSWATGANLSMVLGLGIALAWLMPRVGARGLLITSVGMAAGLIAGNVWLWQAEKLVLDLAIPLLLILGLTAANLASGFVSEARQRIHLKKMFGQYVPHELVDQMIDQPDHATTESQSREMTVLFSDIRDFTTLSESLEPSDLKRLLNEFFGTMTRIIFEHRGTIDKYVGDMIMAFWGAPLRDEDHALHAVESAIAMNLAMRELNTRLSHMGLPPIGVGIGVNTGIMNVGDMGSEFRRAYTVIGDAVNLASRLEGLTRYYRTTLVVGESTKSHLRNYLFRKLDKVLVKGKHHSVEVYEPLCLVDHASPALVRELELHEQAIDQFRSKRWEIAADGFQQLRAMRPDVYIYQLYLERIEECRNHDLPRDWDGVYERRTK